MSEFVKTGLAGVLDQDTANMHRQLAGIRASRKLGQTLGNYQEVRIRHLHQTLDTYLNAGQGPAPLTAD